MKLEKFLVNDKITAKYETNMSLTLQTTKMNFEKQLGYKVFKNHNCNPQVCVSFCIRCVISTFFNVLSSYFYVLLSLVPVSTI